MNLLIVDDSIVYRSAIRKAAESLNGIDKIDVASNGKIALDFVKSKTIDIVTLDLEMPVMDGLEFIKEVRSFNKKIVIIVFAAESLGDANKALLALEYGANDFLAKRSDAKDIDQSVEHIREELNKRVLAFSVAPTQKNQVSLAREYSFDLKQFSPHALFFGSSTGGPDLWRRIFKKLSDFKPRIPIFLVQHMPPIFTKQFADMLDRMVPFKVQEASDGQNVQAGVFYIAPGDFHMVLEKEGTTTKIRLNQNEKVCFVRPAVNCLLETAPKIYGGNFMTIILTGMGDDGLQAVRKFKEYQIPIIIQDQKTSAVWGMPGAIAAEGLEHQRLTDLEIPDFIKRYAS